METHWRWVTMRQRVKVMETLTPTDLMRLTVTVMVTLSYWATNLARQSLMETRRDSRLSWGINSMKVREKAKLMLTGSGRLMVTAMGIH